MQEIVYQELAALLILSGAKPCSPGCVREEKGRRSFRTYREGVWRTLAAFDLTPEALASRISESELLEHKRIVLTTFRHSLAEMYFDDYLVCT